MFYREDLENNERALLEDEGDGYLVENRLIIFSRLYVFRFYLKEHFHWFPKLPKETYLEISWDLTNETPWKFGYNGSLIEQWPLVFFEFRFLLLWRISWKATPTTSRSSAVHIHETGNTFDDKLLSNHEIE